MNVEESLAWEKFASTLEEWLASGRFADYPEDLDLLPETEMPEHVVRHMRELQSRMLVAIANAERESAGLANSLKALRSMGTSKYTVSRSAYLDTGA